MWGRAGDARGGASGESRPVAWRPPGYLRVSRIIAKVRSSSCRRSASGTSRNGPCPARTAMPCTVDQMGYSSPGLRFGSSTPASTNSSRADRSWPRGSGPGRPCRPGSGTCAAAAVRTPRRTGPARHGRTRSRPHRSPVAARRRLRDRRSGRARSPRRSPSGRPAHRSRRNTPRQGARRDWRSGGRRRWARHPRSASPRAAPRRPDHRSGRVRDRRRPARHVPRRAAFASSPVERLPLLVGWESQGQDSNSGRCPLTSVNVDGVHQSVARPCRTTARPSSAGEVP